MIPRWRLALLAAISSAAVSCGGSSASSMSQVRDAVRATAEARSLTVSLTTIEAVYQAPDRVMQIEHGVGSGAKSASDGSVESGPRATYPTTITKVFVGDRYYESDAANGRADPFAVATRCPNHSNVAEFVIHLLREVASHGTLTGSGDTYTFRLAHQDGGELPSTGTITVKGGYVASITMATRPTPISGTWTISSINSSPPVTAPTSASPMNMTCDRSSS